MNVIVNAFGQTDKQVKEKDMLFATLDTSIRHIKYDGRSFLLLDTVGFISDLPHELIQSFHSTLSAVRDADLLVEVVDISDENWQHKMQVTEDTLKQINADHIPVLRVFNKADCLQVPCNFIGHLISCYTKVGIEEFYRVLIETLYPNELEMTYIIPYDKIAKIFHQNFGLKLTVLESLENGSLTHIQGPSYLVQRLKKDLLKER